MRRSDPRGLLLGDHGRVGRHPEILISTGFTELEPAGSSIPRSAGGELRRRGTLRAVGGRSVGTDPNRRGVERSSADGNSNGGRSVVRIGSSGNGASRRSRDLDVDSSSCGYIGAPSRSQEPEHNPHTSNRHSRCTPGGDCGVNYPLSVWAVGALAGAVSALTLAYRLGASRLSIDKAAGCLAKLLRIPAPVPPEPLEPDEPLEIEVPLADWDPAPTEEHIGASRCRALLLEVVRRAAHDWILYRLHDRLQLRQIAEEAYIWLFEEGPGHSWNRTRKLAGSTITSFLTICDLLDLDPEFVRRRIRDMTAKEIMTAGRPAEHRRRRHADDGPCVEYETGIDLDALEGPSDCSSSYEAHFSLK